MKNRAVIYIRVSSDEQVDNMSLKEQLRICEMFCANKDFVVDMVYSEEGESAKTANRTELKKLLEYCRQNRKTIGHLVVYKLDRFARNLEDHTALRVLLKKMGIILWSATEPISGTTTGVLMENVLASFAQFDNEQRAERCKTGMTARALEGGWVAHAPIGYVNVKDDLKRPTLALSDKKTVQAVKDSISIKNSQPLMCWELKARVGKQQHSSLAVTLSTKKVNYLTPPRATPGP